MRIYRFLVAMTASAGLNASAPAQFIVNDPSSTYSTTFDGFKDLAVTWANENTSSALHFHLFNHDGTTPTSFGNSDGSNTGSGAFYNYGSIKSEERALGTITSTSGSSSTRSIAFNARNDSGSTLTGVQIAYRGEQWRRAETPVDKLDFQYKFDSTFTGTAPWIDVDSLDFNALQNSGSNTGLDGNANFTELSGTINFTWNPGERLWIRWLDSDVTGVTDHGLAIDDFTFAPVPVPEPATVLALAAGGLGLMRLGRRRSGAVV